MMNTDCIQIKSDPYFFQVQNVVQPDCKVPRERFDAPCGMGQVKRDFRLGT